MGVENTLYIQIVTSVLTVKLPLLNYCFVVRNYV